MKYALPALAAALALAGCDSTPEETTATTESAVPTTDSGAMAAPAATEPVLATPGPTATMESDGATVTAGPDGTRVTVEDEDVEMRATAEGAPAATTPDR